MLENDLDYYWPVMGAWMCGAAVSAASPQLDATVIRKQVENCGAKLIFCQLAKVETALLVQTQCPDVKVVLLHGEHPKVTFYAQYV